MAPPIDDLKGKKYGRLLVMSRAGNVNRNVAWNCLCDCGTTKVVQSKHLKGNTSSCGCWSTEYRTTHGMGNKGPLYNVWANMIQRCTNPKRKCYPDYGGRGIKVCERWRGEEGYVNFLADMGERPKGLTLDRRENDGHYEPGNCRWATRKEQSNNQRPRKPKGEKIDH